MIPKTPMIAAYTVVGSTVWVLRVLHSARKWPDRALRRESFKASIDIPTSAMGAGGLPAGGAGSIARFM